MGGQFNYWGLWIDSAFGNGECSESCTTYKNYKTLCPKKKFHINKLEAWGVGEPSLTPEELVNKYVFFYLILITVTISYNYQVV